ncbi:MAG: DUF362 domain-containing protein [Acidobacteriota bacterium]
MATRRTFVRSLAAGSLGAAVFHPSFSMTASALAPEGPTATNVKDAERYPRTADSMPGKFPGRVVQVTSERSMAENTINEPEIARMVREGIMKLTGAEDAPSAWRMFVSPTDRIGLKVNPIGGTLLSTSHEIVRSVIAELASAGIPKENILIWDRREFELHEAGFTEERYPGIAVRGTERKDASGSFYDAKGKLYGEAMIDKDWYYWADCEQAYDAETIPYMINEGKHSYFSRICTKDVDKIINIPILKNAGSSVTLCMKNLAFGSISNTGRLHKTLWAETCAEVCAFPPLRDKTVLNIVDGIRGCYQGGPGANPQFITNYKTVLIGTDPVAVDRVGYEIVLKKRIAEKIQKEDSPKARRFMELAAQLKLGVADLDKITHEQLTL